MATQESIPLMTPDPLPQPLTSFTAGVVVQLAFLSLMPVEADRLRDLGIREGNPIHILRNEEALICAVESSRIVLRREIAQQVFATLHTP